MEGYHAANCKLVKTRLAVVRFLSCLSLKAMEGYPVYDKKG